MNTHNGIIYHCLTCGKLVHAAVDMRPPQCCGSEMVNAAAETIYDTDDPTETATPSFETTPPVATVRTIPR